MKVYLCYYIAKKNGTYNFAIHNLLPHLNIGQDDYYTGLYGFTKSKKLMEQFQKFHNTDIFLYKEEKIDEDEYDTLLHSHPDLRIQTFKFNSKYEDIRVYISPSILKCCFEVDRDVMELFKDKFNYIDNFISFKENNNGEDKYYIDTVKINVKVMKKLGIKKEHIFCSNICTKCNSNI